MREYRSQTPGREDRALETRISRRALLGSAAAGALSAGLFSAVSREEAEAASLPPPATWDQEADIVVLGYGGAGVSAAIEAAKAGASVLLLEKRKTLGGSTAASGGEIYLGGGTAVQKGTGNEDTAENMFRYMRAAMGPSQDEEPLRQYANSSVEHFNWLVSLGVKYAPKFTPYKTVLPRPGDSLAFTGNEKVWPFATVAKPAARGHVSLPDANTTPAMTVWARLQAGAEAAGAKAITEAYAEHLVQRADGRIVGVRAKVGGRDQFIHARKAVIITTGGFQWNKEMVARHAPWYLDAAPLAPSNEADDGSGHRMAAAVGAELVNMDAGSPWQFVYGLHRFLVRGVLVNSTGRRFIGEDHYGEDVGNAVLREQEGRAYLVIDNAVFRALPGEVRQSLDPIAGRASTIRQLARRIKVPPAALENTLGFYNRQAGRKIDTDFQKAREFLYRLNRPPYLALDFGPKRSIFWITLGGIRTDSSKRVLDTYGAVVPGLYAAGRVAAGISKRHYNSGTAVGDATFFGRVAGKAAAAEPSAG